GRRSNGAGADADRHLSSYNTTVAASFFPAPTKIAVPVGTCIRRTPQPRERHMSAKQEREERKRQDDEEDRREAKRLREVGLLEDGVADRVVSARGRPADFLRAAARQITGDSYRVNVFAGPHAGSARVAHSFFVTADEGGRILSCSPPLEREYGPTTPA